MSLQRCKFIPSRGLVGLYLPGTQQVMGSSPGRPLNHISQLGLMLKLEALCALYLEHTNYPSASVRIFGSPLFPVLYGGTKAEHVISYICAW